MNTIQKSIKNKKEQIEKLNRDIAELEKDLNKLTIKIDGVEYETKEHDFNLNFKEALKLCPEGWRLWTHEECIKLWNNEDFRKSLNLEDCWFFIKNPFNNKKVARFNAYSISSIAYRVIFSCGRYPRDVYALLGIRFCKDLLKRRVK